MKKNIHTVPHEGNWWVEREGSNRPLSVHRTKAAAEDKGASRARKDGVEHVIHGRDGRIQDKDSYGRDPFPPRDKRH